VIRLVRKRGATVPKALTGAALLKKNLDLLRLVTQKNLSFNSNYWKSGKNQLKAESCGKCAYCEAPTTVVAHGDVEHFRPKTIYWWLAYCYENHLFACQICNQTYKSDNFPIKGKRMAAPRIPGRLTENQLRILASRLTPDSGGKGAPLAVRQFEQLARQEKALLIDPYMVNPEEFFAWVADDDLKEVRLIPGRAKGARHVIDAAEACLGLNREELCRVRYRTFQKLETYRDILLGTVPEALRDKVEAQICAMMEPEADFAGMARFFVKKWRLKLRCNEDR
jgi:hypothetical protein